MLMSRRYWSSEPSSNEDFLLFGVVAIRGRFLGTAASPRRVTRGGARGPTMSWCLISMHALAEPHPTDVGQPGEISRVGSEAEVHDLRTPTQQRVGDEAPIPAVEGVVAVVAEYEVLLPRDDQRAPIVTGWMVCHRRARGTHQEVALPAEFVPYRIGFRVGVGDVGLGQRDPVPAE